MAVTGAMASGVAAGGAAPTGVAAGGADMAAAGGNYCCQVLATMAACMAAGRLTASCWNGGATTATAMATAMTTPNWCAQHVGQGTGWSPATTAKATGSAGVRLDGALFQSAPLAVKLAGGNPAAKAATAVWTAASPIRYPLQMHQTCACGGLAATGRWCWLAASLLGGVMAIGTWTGTGAVCSRTSTSKAHVCRAQMDHSPTATSLVAVRGAQWACVSRRKHGQATVVLPLNPYMKQGGTVTVHRQTCLRCQSTGGALLMASRMQGCVKRLLCLAPRMSHNPTFSKHHNVIA